MNELTQIVVLVAIIGLLIVWTPPIYQDRAPRAGDEVCPMCKRALLKMHNHGVRVFPAPTTPRPRPIPSPPQWKRDR